MLGRALLVVACCGAVAPAAPRPRPNIVVAFGLTVRGLQPGQYQITVFPHSSVTGAFENPQTRTIAAASNPGGNVDIPAPEATVPLTFGVGGWAFDRAAASGSGIDVIDIWAYPGGTGSGTPPVFLGETTMTADRPDVVAAFQDPQILHCGYGTLVTVPGPGLYDVAVFPRSTLTGLFTPYVRRVTAQ